MHILLDQVEHSLRNRGNNALLEAALRRLTEIWPHAKTHMITNAPNLARLLFPSTTPVNPYNLQPYRGRMETLQRSVPDIVWQSLFELREELWHRRIGATAKTTRMELGQDGELMYLGIDSSSGVGEPNHNDLSLQRTFANYDLYVATGGGYMCDHDKSLVLELLKRLSVARQQGVRTVLVGQGVGPMSDPVLLAKAKEVLPGVDLLCYRNERLGRPLLDALGMPPEKIMLTGDDAVEMAFNAHRSSVGTGIGVSLRVSSYTQVDPAQIIRIRESLHHAARKRNATLIAVPISSALHESDSTYIRQLVGNYPNAIVGRKRLSMPRESINLAGQCRLMITGTYHGAIFALAQGVPVIGVASSVEYFNKLSELNDTFGEGCQVIRLDEESPEQLCAAIDFFWLEADRLRSRLLEAAAHQIALQRAAYRRISDIASANAMSAAPCA